MKDAKALVFEIPYLFIRETIVTYISGYYTKMQAYLCVCVCSFFPFSFLPMFFQFFF